MLRTRERSPSSPRLDHIRRTKLGVIQTWVGAVGTSRVRDRLAGCIDQDGAGCKPLLVAPESDWKLNHPSRSDRPRPTVNHLIENGQVTVGVADPTVGCTRRSRPFGHRSANDGWCDPKETRETCHRITRTCSVTHAIRFAVPVEITAIGRHKVHHLVVPWGARVRWFAPIRQALVILEDALRNSVALCECETPSFVSSHVTRNILVDRPDVVQSKRIVVAIVVVTTHGTPWVPLKEGRERNRFFLRRICSRRRSLLRRRRTWFL